MFEFKIIEVDKYNLMLVDDTRVSFEDLPENIYSLKLDIISSKIPETIYDIDVMAYLFSGRTENELYIVNSDSLGLASSGIQIPDGVYTFNLKVNNSYTETNKVVVLNEVQEKIKELMASTSYAVEVTDTEIIFSPDTVTSDIHKLNYAVALYYTLLDNISINPDETVVNDLLDKLNRVLNIITI